MSCESFARAMRGWFGACLTATAIIELFFLSLLALARVNSFAVLSVVDFAFAILIGVPFILVFVCVLSSIPSAVAVWLSERFCIRSPLFFGIAGGLIGATSQIVAYRSFDELGWLFVVAGCFAGLNYWHISGRRAGDAKR